MLVHTDAGRAFAAHIRTPATTHTQFENTHAYAHPNPHEPDSRTRKVVGINGSNISLADFAGNVSIVVNVATL